MTYLSRLLTDVPGIRHAFLDVHESAAFDQSQIIDIKQVHGTAILPLNVKPDERPQVDGVFTALRGQPIGVVTADCLPVLMASRDGRFIASVHAGWRGTAQGIIEQSVRCFVEQGIAPSDIVVAIGPHIRPCCYEVSADFYPALLSTPAADLVRTHREPLFSPTASSPGTNSARAREPNSLWFNLPEFCLLQLKRSGIAAEHIDVVEKCTYCTPEELGSYRRRTHVPATKTQQVSWIGKV